MERLKFTHNALTSEEALDSRLLGAVLYDNEMSSLIQIMTFGTSVCVISLRCQLEARSAITVVGKVTRAIN